jgi:DNA-binding NarL/FixJ family response regulator
MSTGAPTTIAIEQFEDLVARGLRGLIDDAENLQLIASDIPHGRLVPVLRARPAEVAILNFGALRSPAEVRELVKQCPGTQLVLLANHPSDVESAQLLAFGAAACLAKGSQARDILNAIYLAGRGMQVVVRHTGDVGAGSLLTSRESDVLAQLQQRRSNAQIAADLHIGIETVRTHARNIYRKLGVASRRELLAPPRLEPVLESGLPDRRPRPEHTHRPERPRLPERSRRRPLARRRGS